MNMKNILGLMFIILVSFGFVISQEELEIEPVYECTDSDGGKDYYEKGTTCIGGGLTEEIQCKVDQCVHPDCVGCKDQILEYYCEGNEIQSELVDCPNGCKDGACVSSSINTAPEIIGIPAVPEPAEVGKSYSFGWEATDEDNDDLVWSVDWGDGIGEEGLCASPTLSNKQGWKFETSHSWSKVGTYTVKATVNDCKGGTDTHSFSVKVGDTTECRDENYPCTPEDIPCCSGLKEVPLAFEDENGRCIAATCGSICRPCGNGICDENENRCNCPEDCEAVSCTDSDGGKNIYVAGEAKGSDGMGTLDNCNFLQSEKGILHEAICEDGRATHVKIICPSEAPYCNRGICSTKPPKCEDTDGGNSPYVRGTITEPRYKDGPRHTDYCENLDTKQPWNNCKGNLCGIREYYCTSPYRTTTYQDIKCPNGCRDGACISSPPQGIYVKLGEKFSLAEKGEAKVTDYNYMKIILNEIEKVCLESYPLKCYYIVSVGVEMPSLSEGPDLSSTGTEFTLKEGESKEVFGAKLTFLRVAMNIKTGKEYATFVVDKSISEGGVDIEINPAEQTISYGEKAVYKVTVTDKHPVPVCPEGSVCEEKLFLYKIHIRNLPFSKEYPKEIWVSSGGSKSFELIVRPYGIVEEEGVIEIEEKAVEIITGKIVETPTIKKAFIKPVKKAEVMIYEKKEVPVEEEVSAESVEAVKVEKVEIEPIKEEPAVPKETDEEEPIVVTPTTHLMRRYKFSVTAKLKDNYKQDTAYALLVIKPETPPTPPPFPGEKVSIKLYKGWNLISLPGKLIRFDKESIGSSKLIGFVYIKDEQKYVSLNEAEKILGDKLREYLAKNAFWIYSRTPSTLNIWIDRKISYQDLELVKGWNLVPITEDMLGGYLTDITGDCDLEKLYLWDENNQRWEKISLEYSFSDYQFGYGFLVKATDYCKFVGPEIIAPPEMPE